MQQNDVQEIITVEDDESLKTANTTRRVFRFIFFAFVAAGFFLAFYPHLVRQAMSQGFVLEELEPFMNLLIGWGRSLYWFGGRPLATPALLLTAGVLLPISFQFLLRKTKTLLSDRLLIFFTCAFLLMYLIGGTASFGLYIAGIILVVALGWLGEWRRVADDEGPASSIDTKEKIIVAAILLLGLLLRLYALDIFPRLFSIDEQLFAQVVLQLGEKPLEFFAQPHIMKPHLLHIAALRLGFSTLGVGLFQERLVSVLEGTLTIVLIFLVCRGLWGRQAGLFAAFLLAVDPWHIGHSRSGVHNIEGPLFLALLLLLIIRAVRRGGKKNFAFLGAAAGGTFYLYLSCLIMAPFAWAAVLLGRFFAGRQAWKTIAKETSILGIAFVLAALPYFTVGRKNISQLEDFYSRGGNVLTASRDHGWNPVFTFFVNFWNGVEFLINWTSRSLHPCKTFYPNPIAIGLFLLGLGMLLAKWKKFENMLILMWIPAAWIPMSLSYGFAERRLFATLALIPSMLGGLALAKLWKKAGNDALIVRFRQLLVLGLLVPLVLISMFIVFRDSDPVSGGRVQPPKVAEYVGSLPPEYTVLISNRVKEIPFLVYLESYERINKANKSQKLSFVSIEELEGTAEKIALTPGIAMVLDPHPRDYQLLYKLKSINPRAQILESKEFLACLIPTTEQRLAD